MIFKTDFSILFFQQNFPKDLISTKLISQNSKSSLLQVAKSNMHFRVPKELRNDSRACSRERHENNKSKNETLF